MVSIRSGQILESMIKDFLGPTRADTVCVLKLCAKSVRFIEATFIVDTSYVEYDGIMGMGLASSTSTTRSVCFNKYEYDSAENKNSY